MGRPVYVYTIQPLHKIKFLNFHHLIIEKIQRISLGSAQKGGSIFGWVLICLGKLDIHTSVTSLEQQSFAESSDE